jgi:hypothetical protein
MKKIFITIAFFVSIKSYSQKTNVPVEGISVFKIGDTVTLVNSYGFEFRELFIDSEYNYSEKHQNLDSGLNFCNTSRVFYCDNIKIDEFEFSQGGILTYFNNKLIDISLLNILNDKLQEVLKQKYGMTFGKIFLAGYQFNLQKIKAKGLKVTPQVDKQLQDLYLSSIYWTNGGNIISVGGSNCLYEYDFAEQHYVTSNLGKGGVSVTNIKEYQKLVECSNTNLKVRIANYLKNLKLKSSSF